MEKPGYRTTEFWLSIAATAVGAAMASGAFASGGSMAKIFGLAASTLAALGYTACRTWGKANG